MGEITNRQGTRRGVLAQGVFKILCDKPEGLSVKEIFPRLEKSVPPTAFEQKMYPNRPNVRRYETIVRFATIPSVKAGWLVKNRGHWLLTEAGKQAYRSTSDPEEFFRRSWDEYRKWKEGQPPQETEGDDDKPDDSDMPSVTLERSEEDAWAEVENHLAEMPPFSFQETVAGLLEGMGHHIEWVAPPGPDGGVDIHAASGGVSGKRIKVQVKRKRDTLNVDAIRSFRDTLREGDTGLFISTSGFTSEAAKEARQGQRHLVLIDGKRFFDLWVSHYEKIPEKRRLLLPIKLVAFLDSLKSG